MDRRTGETSVVIGQLQREMERLKAELSFTQEQAQEQKEAFEEERLHWLDEKQKVGITYLYIEILLVENKLFARLLKTT